MRKAQADAPGTCRSISLTTFLSPYWPSQGSRDNAGLVIAGVLANCGVRKDLVCRIAGHAATHARHADLQDRVSQVTHTYSKVSKGQNVTGIPSLKKYMPVQAMQQFGDLAKTVGEKGKDDPLAKAISVPEFLNRPNSSFTGLANLLAERADALSGATWPGKDAI